MRSWSAAPLAFALFAGCAYPGSAVAQMSDDVVKLGVLTDMTSLYSDATGSGSLIAAQMAAEDYGGKVLGRPIEVIFADHQNKPDVGANIARQWIENDGVNVILDLPNSAVGLAVREVTRTRDAVDINTGAATSDLSGKACSPHGVHWSFDTYGLAATIGQALVKQGGDSWFFITADYAFGHALERDTTAFVVAGGGKVVGAVRHPLNTADFSSYLLQAQASKAKIIGIASGPPDNVNAVKLGGEFGIFAGGQQMAGLLMLITDVHALGLKAAQGLLLTTSFYWDTDDKTREWSKRFFAKINHMPTMWQAGVYSSVMHYLNAVKAAGTDDPLKVAAKMRETPIEDFFSRNGRLREDNLMVHDLVLVQVKKPEDSRYPWDYYQILTRIPGEQAFGPPNPACPLVKQ